MFKAIILKYLAITCLIEMAVVYALLYKQRDRLLLLNVVLINIMTNIPLNYSLLYSFYSTLGMERTSYLIFCEVAIVLVEMVLYRMMYEYSWKKCFFISFTANAASFVIGGMIG